MSKKIKSSLLNMVLSLSIITIIMASALGFVYGITKKPIEDVSKNKEIQALKEVLPEFNNDPIENAIEIDGLYVYVGKNENDTVGFAVKTFSNNGYSGRIDLMVGFNFDGSIRKIVVLEHAETPGLGAKMTEDTFLNQFFGLNLANLEKQEIKVKKDGGTIDAITASTITSRAFCQGVQRAYDNVQNLIKNNSEKNTKGGNDE